MNFFYSASLHFPFFCHYRIRKSLLISSFDIGSIVVQGTKFAFEDSGYVEQHIQFLAQKRDHESSSHFGKEVAD